jgi:hypothetical protein
VIVVWWVRVTGNSEPEINLRVGGPHGSGFDEPENLSLIHSTPAERKRLQHSVDRLLVAAEHVTGEWFGQ